MDTITCVLVIDNLGDHVWIPIAEWRTNPLCVLLPVEDVRKPIVKDSSFYWRIEKPKSAGSFADVRKARDHQKKMLYYVLYGDQ
jgi:hypothetical protein